MKVTSYCLIFLTSFNLSLQAQTIPTDENSIIHGEELFELHCVKCHTFGEQQIGPSLSSITDKRPVSWLLYFIESSQSVIQSGDPYAKHLYRSYNNMVMPDFRQLDEKDRLDILAYIHNKSIGEYYDYVTDSVNYYDADIMDKAERRYSQEQEQEVDYYSKTYEGQIPNDPETVIEGGDLFEEHCATCHRLDKRKKGPALASVTDRLPLPWLMDFINDPTEMMRSGDDYANFLVTNYPFVMPNFGYLDDSDKLTILAYIKNESGVLTNIAGTNANAETQMPVEDTLSVPDELTIGDQDEMGLGEDAEDTYRLLSRPIAMLMGGVLILLVILGYKMFRK